MRVCCCSLGCNVNKHVHGRSDICCMRRNPSHQRRNVNNATQLPVQLCNINALFIFFLKCSPLLPHLSIQQTSRAAQRRSHAAGQLGGQAGWLAGSLAGSLAGWPTTHPVAVDSYRNRKLARVRRGCKTSERDPLAAHKKRALARKFSTVA